MLPNVATEDLKLSKTLKNGVGEESGRCLMGEVPSTGWIRASHLFGSGVKFKDFGSAEREKILRELSTVRDRLHTFCTRAFRCKRLCETEHPAL